MLRLFGVPGADALDASEYAAFHALASPGRRERVDRFLRREDASRALIAEALLRLAARVSGLNLDEVPLHYNSHGKPFLPDADFEFNIAHSGEWVLCATAIDEIGIDIERHHGVDFGIAERFFSRPENALLASVDTEPARVRTFFDIWSLKESYIKAIGMGLSCSLDRFACLPSASGAIGFRLFDGSLPHRHFQLVDFVPGYSCAVCTLSSEPALSPRLLAPRDLLAAMRV